MDSNRSFKDDHRRWSAVVARNHEADGTFVYGVKSTMIFCRPICKARLARRANVVFYDTPAEAEAAGFRPCKRCQPLLPSYAPEADKIKKVCILLDTLPIDAPLPGLERLAQEAGLTKHHFHRLFKRETGFTPRQYAIATRRASSNASESTDSTAMTPITPITPFTNNIETPVLRDDEPLPDFDFTFDAEMKEATTEFESLVIYYGLVDTTYGLLLVAFQNRQVCKVELGTTEGELLEILESSYPSLYNIHSPVDLANSDDYLYFRQQVEAVVEALENPSGKVLEVPVTLSIGSEEAVS